MDSKLYVHIFNRISDVYMAAAPGCGVLLSGGTVSKVAFHNLTFEQASKVLNTIMLPFWQVDCIQNNLSCGSFCNVTQDGVGNTTLSYLRIGPFQTEL